MIDVAAPGVVKLDYGPVQMTIYAYSDQGPMTEAAQQAAKYARSLLTELAEKQKIAAQPQQHIIQDENLPAVLQLMIGAVQRSGDSTLTPMAAIAGTMADLAADWLVEQGATKAIVNNGGDIAVRLKGCQKTTVGVAPAIGVKPTHVLPLDSTSAIGGIATSGLGGRSFTKGIASAAVVMACTARLADACATSLANATYVSHPAVRIAWAEDMDPNTDICGHQVVREVGCLPPEVVRQALQNGREKAALWHRQGLIQGAAIFVQQQWVMIPEDLLLESTHSQ